MRKIIILAYLTILGLRIAVDDDNKISELVVRAISPILAVNAKGHKPVNHVPQKPDSSITKTENQAG